MDRDADRKPEKKAWKAPGVRQFDLTEDEKARLKASDDPMALLFELRPELKAGGFD